MYVYPEPKLAEHFIHLLNSICMDDCYPRSNFSSRKGCISASRLAVLVPTSSGRLGKKRDWIRPTKSWGLYYYIFTGFESTSPACPLSLIFTDSANDILVITGINGWAAPKGPRNLPLLLSYQYRIFWHHLKRDDSTLARFRTFSQLHVLVLAQNSFPRLNLRQRSPHYRYNL